MNERKHNARDSIWLLVLGWLTVQSAVLLVILNRLLRREKERTMPEAQQPQAAAMPIAPAQTSQQETSEEESRAGRLERYWDVIGLTSVAVTVAGAAVFYIAGWIYEAHWYGYYGIEISQLALAPHQVMVQGVPGILLLIFSTSLSLAWFSMGKLLAWIKNSYIDWSKLVHAREIIQVRRKDILLIVIQAYFLTFILVTVSAFGLAFIGTREFPWEVLLCIVPAPIIWATVDMVSTIDASTRGMLAALVGDYSRIPFRITAWSYALLARLWLFLLSKPWIRRCFGIEKALSELDEDRKKQVLEVLQQMEIDVDEEELSEPSGFLRRMFEFFDKAYAKLFDKVIENGFWFWLSLILTLFFLVSVSASAILAEFDARRGARSLSGNWHLPMTFLFSERPVSVLQEHEQENDHPGFVYGPFGLVTSSESTLFLAEWKETQYYERRPILYLVPQRPEQALSFSQPTPTPTPTATPTL